jgi:hypothetical protein
MFRIIVLLSLVALLNAADLNNETTKFTSIGSNLVPTNTTTNDNSNNNNNNSHSAIPPPLSQSVSAQARKIEMTQQLNAAGAVVTSMKTNSGGNAVAASSTTMIIILVSLVLVTCLIAMIGTALFVMRRRFSIWRLNNSKLNLNEGGEEKSSTSSGSSSSGGVEGTEVVNGGGEEFAGGVGGEGETKEKTILNLTPQPNVVVVEMVAETQGHLNEAAAVETTNEGRKKGSGKWDVAIILPKLFYFQSREFFSNLPSY